MTDVRAHVDVDHVIERWEAALGGHDAGGLVATYAEDAVLESPLVPHVTGKQGQLRGHGDYGPSSSRSSRARRRGAAFTGASTSPTEGAPSGSTRESPRTVSRWTSSKSWRSTTTSSSGIGSIGVGAAST